MSNSSPMPRLMRYLPPILTALLIAVSIWIGSQMSLSGLISYTPKNSFLAAGGILLLYVVKSLSVVFPLSALYLVAAFWFGPVWGILISYIGLVISCSIPYCLGRHFGSGVIAGLVQKYPRLDKLQKTGISNEIMLSYLMRIVSILPGDLCSLFLGACSIRYPRYMIGSLLGLSPMMILHVLFADIIAQSVSGSFLDALTPASVTTIIVLVAVSVVSSVLLNKYKR